MKKLVAKKLLISATAFLAMLVSLNVFSHSRWIIPSHTILSGDTAEYVSLDFSISNDIFHPDLPLGGDILVKPNEPNPSLLSTAKLKITYPDGSVFDDSPLVNLGRKSSSAVQLMQSGTYRFNVEQAPVLITTFKNADGSPNRRFGSLKSAKASAPEGAKSFSTMKVHNWIETFVTRNQLNDNALSPRKKGLALVYQTHPNENFANESANFQLLLDGKPVTEALALRLTRGGTRFRNQRHVIEPRLDEQGRFSVEWPEGGFYLLEAEVERESEELDIAVDVYALYVTLEVNPE